VVGKKKESTSNLRARCGGGGGGVFGLQGGDDGGLFLVGGGLVVGGGGGGVGFVGVENACFRSRGDGGKRFQGCLVVKGKKEKGGGGVS